MLATDWNVPLYLNVNFSGENSGLIKMMLIRIPLIRLHQAAVPAAAVLPILR